MTPQEKAMQLVDKFARIEEYKSVALHTKFAKANALIAVDEIIEGFTKPPAAIGFPSEKLVGDIKYWKSVKTEIESL